MVTAFRIDLAEDFQKIEPVESFMDELQQIFFGAPLSPAAPRWSGMTFFVPDPRKRRGQFFDASAGNFACTDSVLRQFEKCLARDCEFLPIVVNDFPEEQFFLIHPIHAVAALPRQEKLSAADLIDRRLHPPYRREAFDRPMLFRDPQQPLSSIAISDLGAKEEDFYRLYLDSGCAGLGFRKLWRCESSPTPTPWN